MWWRTAVLAVLVTATTAGIGACSDDEGSAEELCQAVRANPSITSTFQGFDPTDASAAVEQLRTALVSLEQLRDAAPAEVRDDIVVEIDYVTDLIEGLGEVPEGEPAEAVGVVQRVTGEHPDVGQAAANLEAFAASSCR